MRWTYMYQLHTKEAARIGRTHKCQPLRCSTFAGLSSTHVPVSGGCHLGRALRTKVARVN